MKKKSAAQKPATRSIARLPRAERMPSARGRKRGPVSRTRSDAIAIRPLESDDWSTVSTLFGSNGACGGCWCMWWRVEKGGKTWEEAKGEKNRTRMAKLVKQGRVHAMIAFAGDEPIGWCSFGPRPSFPRLLNSRVLRHETDEHTWSIVCFFIPAAQRGKGLATRLLDAASRRAFALGARSIEGYPVVPHAKDERMPAAFAWTGVPAVFEAVGYAPITRASGMRPIYELESPPRRARAGKR